jgi:hypothetical protein
MRLMASVVTLSLALWGRGLHAQGVVFGHPTAPSTAPSLHIEGFRGAPVVPNLRPPPSESSRIMAYGLPPLNTCPMPVARGDSSADRMSVGTTGNREPMPVARSGCWNPLDAQP